MRVSIVSPAYFIMRVPLVFNGTQLIPSCTSCKYADCEHVTFLCSNTSSTPPFGHFADYSEAFPFFNERYTDSIVRQLQNDDWRAARAGQSWPYHAYLIRARLIRGSRARLAEAFA